MSIPSKTIQQRRVLAGVLIALCAAGALVLLYQTRYLFLDDTFIHLRIASHLARQGHYSFNGDRTSFGTSSPLYTLLLALLWKVWPASLLPKLVNVPIYAALLATIAWVAVGRRLVPGSSRSVTWLALLWLVITASPLAIRWLTDGMETGLVALSAAWLGILAVRFEEPGHGVGSGHGVDRAPVWPMFFLTLVAAWLRVEFAYLSALIGAACFAQWWMGHSRPSAGSLPPSWPRWEAACSAWC